jgi:hypothetical protein
MPILIYDTGMTIQYTQLRIWRTTLNKLRMIYAMTGESMIAVVDRLAEQELQRIQDESHQDVQVQAVPREKE